mgnify:CR=1 FL=1|jgi:hypothetical protein
MTLHGGSAWVALLPSEIILQIVESLSRFELKTFSCINKRLRELCVPSIFSKVKFEFSKSGLEALNHLLGSDVRRHVRSMTYVTTELLEPGKKDLSPFSAVSLIPAQKRLNSNVSGSIRLRQTIAKRTKGFGMTRNTQLTFVPSMR